MYFLEEIFSEVTFTSEKEGVLYFNGKDEDGNVAEISFESVEDKMIVAARLVQDDKWVIVDTLYPGIM